VPNSSSRVFQPVMKCVPVESPRTRMYPDFNFLVHIKCKRPFWSMTGIRFLLLLSALTLTSVVGQSEVRMPAVGRVRPAANRRAVRRLCGLVQPFAKPRSSPWTSRKNSQP